MNRQNVHRNLHLQYIFFLIITETVHVLHATLEDAKHLHIYKFR